MSEGLGFAGSQHRRTVESLVSVCRQSAFIMLRSLQRASGILRRAAVGISGSAARTDLPSTSGTQCVQRCFASTGESASGSFRQIPKKSHAGATTGRALTRKHYFYNCIFE